MSTKTVSKKVTESHKGDCRIVVNSIGNAGLRLIPAIQKASPLPAPQIAALLYRAPSELISDLSHEAAEKINHVLQSAGLESRVMTREETFTAGDADHEVALVVKDMSRMASVGLLVMEILGLDVDGARKLLFSSPTVLVGSISANTVNALKRRFQPLDVELDVSRPEEALFDIFLGDCPPSDRAKVENLLKKYRIPMVEDAGKEKLPVLALGLSKAQADQVWHRLLRYNLPVRVVNRDYQRYDMVLEESPASKDMIEFLTDTTGMPEEVALKVTQQTPIVTHQNIRFDEMTEYLEAITLLEGRASSHLLLFQTFSLVLEEMGDKETTSELLQAIGGLESGQAFEVMNKTHRVEGPLSKPRARWLQWELREVGTEAKMVLR